MSDETTRATAATGTDLADYFAQRQQERQTRAQRMWNLLKPRDQRLVREAAVMGYVLGERSGGHRHDDFPRDAEIVAQVLLACESHGDLYPTMRRLARRAARA